jgi:RNA polymerase sigma factor (sigma-70 family)
MTDLELAKACIAGNRTAQKTVYDRNARGMMTVCMRYTGNRMEAEDVFQEGFVKAFNNMHQYNGAGPLGGWLRMIMVNTAINHLRATKKLKYAQELEVAERLAGGEESALQGLANQDLLELVSRMPDGYRTVFNLFAIEGFAHKEIGEQLGISENTSKTQFLKARNWLKKQLELSDKHA